MDPKLIAITLNLIPGLGPVKMRKLIDFFGSPELILEAPKQLLQEVPLIGPQLAENIANWRSLTNAEREYETAVAAGARVTSIFDEEYPVCLRDMADPPIVLYSWGMWTDEDCARSVAVVGSRMATHYGRSCTKKFAYELAQNGVSIISGLARGIDTIAHEAALDAQGRTIAVIGSGLSKLYPQENLHLAEYIADGHGAVISEFPMMMGPSKTTFPMRNRIVSAWAGATLVIEAPARSGALITARMAAEAGKTVYAVPGPIDRGSSDGCHALIRDGAILTTDPYEIIDEQHWGSKTNDLPLFAGTAEPKPSRPALTPEDNDLLQNIKRGFNTIDALCSATGNPAYVITAKLAQLQIQGYVIPDEGGFFHLK